MEEGSAIDVFTCHASPAGDAPIGRDHRCTLQFWDEHRDRDAADTQDDGTAAERPTVIGSDVPVQLRSPVANRIASSMGRDRLTSSEVVVGGIELATAPEFRWFQRGTEPPFPIDVVYTWVDGDDPEWRRRRDRALGVAASTSRDGSSSERYRSFDELRYSMRSLWQNVAWVGTIHLVTDRQVPAWLDVDHERMRVVDHTEIFGDPAALPTFNSHAIESQLHHIDGLAEHYLYLNDDVFFGRPAEWSTYVDRSGRTRFFPSKARFEPRDPSPFETSVDNAGKNLQQHLFAVTGWAPTTKIKHTPHPQQRSLLYEMEEVFADAFKETSLSRFRSTSDISFAAAMHHRYGEAIGRTQEGTINYQYLNLSGPNLSDRLDALLGSPFDTLCLNDGDIPPGEHEAVRARVEVFLRRRFPYAAPWELDADAPASSPRTPPV
ncbi:stealth family protein [Ilumatobacter sp.]|uniref:stealth family protein n=1 Tax=Ilumatobacter sp. TaxID=1967498 RepID=UPI003B52B78E